MQMDFKDNNQMDLCILNSTNLLDLNVRYFGTQSCIPNQNWGPVSRDHYLIHYILDGSGIFEVNNKTYNLHKGQGFLILPDIPSFYKADKCTPWKYAWIGFSGTKSEYYIANANLNINNPIFSSENDFITDCFCQMKSACNLSHASNIRVSALLQMAFSELIEENGRCNSNSNYSEYIKQAINYIQANINKNISVNEIADYLSLNRSYFSIMFKNELNVSPKEYIKNHKIGKACQLLNNTDLSIKEVAYSVGFNDPLYFSREFKKVMGYPPKKHRE